MKKSWLLVSIAAIVMIYIVGAPYFTVYRMKSAAESRNGEALSEYIEFPSVRQSLKDQMNAMLMKQMSKAELKDNPFGALGVAFAGVMLDKLVEAYVTPAGITQLMSGEKPRVEGGDAPKNGDARKPLSNASMSYESLSKFVVTVKGDNEKEGRFVLRRRGIEWKLTEILIPLE